MADSNILFSVSKVAAADLSSAQYKAVKLDTDGKIAQVAVTTDAPFGIIQNTPETSEVGRVVPIGPGGSSKMYAAEVINEAAQVACNGSGEAVAAASGRYTLGICETAGNTGDLIKVLLNNITIKA